MKGMIKDMKNPEQLKEVLRRCDEAEKYLLTVTARYSYEDRL